MREEWDVPPPLPLRVHYGQFRQFVDLCGQISALEGVRGWAVSTIWTPVVGVANEVIVIADYPSLDAFERERAARRADPEYMKLARATEELMAPGTSATSCSSSRRIPSSPALSTESRMRPASSAHTTPVHGAILCAETDTTIEAAAG